MLDGDTASGKRLLLSDSYGKRPQKTSPLRPKDEAQFLREPSSPASCMLCGAHAEIAIGSYVRERDDKTAVA